MGTTIRRKSLRRFVGTPSPKKILFAKRLRQYPTHAEARLWERLRMVRTPTARLRFHRQRPLLGWIVDFWCPRARLIVEVDGTRHDSTQDAIRDGVFATYGVLTLRVPNHHVLYDTGRVVTQILETARQRIARLDSQKSS